MFSKSFVSNVVKLNPYSYQTAKQYVKGNFKNIISVMEREKKRMPQKKWLGMRIVWRQWVSALVTRLQVKSLQQVTGILQF